MSKCARKCSRYLTSVLWAFFFLTTAAAAEINEKAEVKNLALAGVGAEAKSWELGIRVIPEHEPARAIDGSLHTYWSVSAADLPADLGVEWPAARTISALVVRYFDGKMVRGPAVSRTQQWAKLQYWDQEKWKNIDAQIYGQETSSVRYTFAPVTTTRLRLLFTEPPDPESRRFPDRLGIYVCEFEAYEKAPFQIISAAPGVVQPLLPSQRAYLRNYDEPPQADASYDIPGPLVLEPKQTRVFSDVLQPNLIVETSKWAKQSATADRLPGNKLRLKNGFLDLDLSGVGVLKETQLTNLVTGESISIPDSTAFLIKTSMGELKPESLAIASIDTAGPDQNTAQIRVDLRSDKFDLSVYYQLRRQDHFLHKWIALKNKTGVEVQVLDVTLSSLGLPRTLDLAAGPELTYPIFRMDKGGFFYNLETVYWDHVGDALTYYPGAIVPAKGDLTSEKAVVGVYQNRGEQVAGWERGVREWVIEYHAQVSPIPKGWPDVYCEGWSGNFGVQEMLQHPERAEKRMAVAEEIGIRYLDTYEPAHAALSMPEDWVNRWVELASRHHVATGWWADHGSAADWGMGGPLIPDSCKLSKEYNDYLEKIVALVKTHHLGAMHWGDFLEIWPCANPGPGYLPGKYSIYPQGQRIIRFAQELHEANPDMMLGADGGTTNPQFVRFTDSRSYGIIVGGDNPYGYDHYPAIQPDIHLDRLYGELNRNYFYDLHVDYLRPWFRLLNIVNHYSHEGTHSHDRAGFRYALLSALAMAAQVTFDDIPPEMPESEITFAHDWLQWANQNKEYFTHGDRLFDRTVSHTTQWTNDPDALSGFAHIRDDRGFVFLINPSAADQIADLTLQLDAPIGARFAVKEIYPGNGNLRGRAGSDLSQGGKLTITVPAKQVRILWIGPGSKVPEAAGALAEDKAGSQSSNFVESWSLVRREATSATFRSHFEYPMAATDALRQPTDESLWSKDPWAYDKAYLVILLKDETQEALASDVPDDLVTGGSEPQITLSINGVPKTLLPFKTVRGVRPHLTRCYFVGLSGEIKPGKENEVQITLPIRTGLVFSGAYLDLPDQVPYGEPPRP